MNNYPDEIKTFIDMHRPEDEIQILEYDRYENVIEVRYRINLADGKRVTRTKYIRVFKQNQMSDTNLGG